jgi:hypothetical protein
MATHELVRLEVVRDPRSNTATGIEAECSCGWKTGPHFSSWIAQVRFQDHKDREDRKP